MVELKELNGDPYIIPNVLWKLKKYLDSRYGNEVVDLAGCRFTPAGYGEFLSVLKDYYDRTGTAVKVVNTADEVPIEVCESFVNYVVNGGKEQVDHILEFNGDLNDAIRVRDSLDPELIYGCSRSWSKKLFAFISFVALTRPEILIDMGSVGEAYFEWVRSIINLYDYTDEDTLQMYSNLGIIGFKNNGRKVEKKGYIGGIKTNKFISRYNVLPGSYGKEAIQLNNDSRDWAQELYDEVVSILNKKDTNVNSKLEDFMVG